MIGPAVLATALKTTEHEEGLRGRLIGIKRRRRCEELELLLGGRLAFDRHLEPKVDLRGCCGMPGTAANDMAAAKEERATSLKIQRTVTPRMIPNAAVESRHGRPDDRLLI